MINVNQITSQLARLPDAALQQYAAMHKNDPYTMALALAESNRRKQLRAGGQQNAPQQPTVADQTIAEMHQQAAPMPPQAQGQLPEEQGIGALPTPNMQKMADGGIAGYADGIPKNTFLTKERMGAADAAYANGWAKDNGPATTYNPASQWTMHPFSGYNNTDDGKSSTLGQFLSGIPEWLSGGKEGEAQRAQQEQLLQLQRQRLNADPSLTERLTPAERADRLAQVNAIDAQIAQLRGTTPVTKAAPGQSSPSSVAPQAAPGTTPAAIPQGKFVDARTKVPGTAPAPGAKAPPRATVPGTAPTSGPSSLEEIYKKMQGFGGDAETRKGLADLEKEEIATAASEKAAREAGRPKGEAYGKYEEALTKEGNAAEGKKAENLKMALINAGLAIAGGKSQYALQNIAEGAQVGTKQYQAGLDKLDEAAKAREKEMAMIEQARHAEARGDWKDNISYEHEANKARLDAKKFSLAGLAAINQTNKKETLDLYTEQLKLANADKIAREANAAHLKAYGMMAGNKQNPANIAVDNAAKDLDAWLKTDAGKDATPAQQEAKRLALLKQHFSMQGVAMPAMPGAAVDTTGFKVLRPN